MNTKRITFPIGRAERITARMELPEGEQPLAYAMLAHCFTFSKYLSGEYFTRLEQQAKRSAVLRFDFTGFGGERGGVLRDVLSRAVLQLLGFAHDLPLLQFQSDMVDDERRTLRLITAGESSIGSLYGYLQSVHDPDGEVHSHGKSQCSGNCELDDHERYQWYTRIHGRSSGVSGSREPDSGVWDEGVTATLSA